MQKNSSKYNIKMTQLLKLNKIFKRILEINKILNKSLNQMSNKLFNQVHLNRMCNSTIIIKSLRMKRLLKIKKFNKLLKTRMKFIKKKKKRKKKIKKQA